MFEKGPSVVLILLLCSSGAFGQLRFRGNGGNSRKSSSNPNIFSLLNKSSPPVVLTRNNSPTTKMQGNRCLTPRGENGICSFINEPRCKPVLDAIVRVGVTDQVLRYLRKAIEPPCGFDRTDYTLCCKDSSPPPPTTPRPTTTTSTTTTRAPVNACGIIGFNTRITGGEQADPGEWPWAAILGNTNNGFFQVVCGGTLISNRHVLTAAHCFADGGFSINMVRLGEHDIRSNNDGSNPVDIRIGRVESHSDYSRVSLQNDIALVTLSSPATFTDRIRHACLPNPGDPLPSGEQTIIGWGATATNGGTVNILRETTIPLIENQVCNNAYSDISRITITNKQVCGAPGERDSCTGDSGGPMLTNKINGRWTVIGITSFGVECARQDFPGVYTRVQQFLSWIRARI